jgi:hypothetical protein
MCRPDGPLQKRSRHIYKYSGPNGPLELGFNEAR